MPTIVSIQQGGTGSTNASAAIEALGAVANTGGLITGNLNVAATLITQNVLPDANITYDLGSSTARFKDLWLSNSTIYLGEASISAESGNVSFGNAEIQLSNVTSKLNVTNDLFVSGNVEIGTTGFSERLVIAASGTSNNVTFWMLGTNGNGGISNGVKLKALAGESSSGAGTFTVETRSTDLNYYERLRIDANGSIGIGTTAPAVALHLVGASTAKARFNVSGYAGLEIGQNADFTSEINQRSGSALLFKTDETERARITNTGEFFIGATSALNASTVQISIGSGASSAPRLGVFNTGSTPTSSATTTIQMGFLSGGANYVATDTILGSLSFLGQANDEGYGGASIQAKVVSGGNVGRGSGHGVDLIFNTKPTNNTGVLERMRLDASGRLGIGTNSPATLLDVAGTITADDAGFYQASGTSQLRVGASSSYNWNISRDNDSTGGLLIQSKDNAADVTRMFIGLTGNVGIGTSSPSRQLVVYGSAPYLALQNSTTGSTNGDGFQLQADGNDAYVFNYENSFIVFGTNATERARLDASGNLLVGTTTPLSTTAHSFQALGTTSGDYAAAFQQNATGGSGRLLRWILPDTNNSSAYFVFATNSDGNCLNIFGDGDITNTNNSYGAISDVKLKENIVDATPKLDNLCQVRVVNYNFKNNPDLKQIGVVAQELEQVFPGMVEETADLDAEGNDLGTKSKSVKYSVFVPMLIKAIQELKAELDATKAEVAALKGAN